MFRYVVLGLLHGGRPQHGYALMKAYHDRVGTKLSTGNFYRDLQRLVGEGLVRTVERAHSDDSRRAPYQITAEGRATFRDWFVTATAIFTSNGPEDQLALRLAFLADVAPDDARQVLRHFQDELWSRAKSLERAREAALAESERSGGLDFPVLALMLGRRVRRIAAELAFLEDLRANYEEWLTRQDSAGEPRATEPMPAPRARAPRLPPSGRARSA